MSIQRINPTARYADASVFGSTVYAVEVPISEVDDARTQAQEILDALEATLALAGSGKDQLLMATVYITDLADLDAINAVWEAWLPPGAAPARACVRVAGLAKPGWRLEIAVTAAVLDA